MPSKKDGRRFVVGNGSNSAFLDRSILFTVSIQQQEKHNKMFTVSMLQVVKEKHNKIFKWLDFVSKSRKNFDSKHAKTVCICDYDSHFLEGDFCNKQYITITSWNECTGQVIDRRKHQNLSQTLFPCYWSRIRSFTSTSASGPNQQGNTLDE